MPTEFDPYDIPASPGSSEDGHDPVWDAELVDPEMPTPAQAPRLQENVLHLVERTEQQLSYLQQSQERQMREDLGHLEHLVREAVTRCHGQRSADEIPVGRDSRPDGLPPSQCETT